MNKRCQECAFIVGHRYNCSEIKDCKHRYATTYKKRKKFWKFWIPSLWTAQCIHCLLLQIFTDKEMKEWTKQLKKDGFKHKDIFI